jgi:glycosyltransferase involved in cell wall biosynthesis
MFEALAARVPVVVSNTLNFAPAVERFQAGKAVERTPDAFADAIAALLNSPETRRQMGQAGARLAAKYSWEAIGKQMERAIEAVIANQPLPRDLVLGQALL